jgi:hypothetical protein
MLDLALEWYAGYPENLGYGGMLDYGDIPRMVWGSDFGLEKIKKGWDGGGGEDWYRWAHPRGGWWNNGEKDLYLGLFLQWLRTGDPRYYEQAMASAWHSVDVDTKWWVRPDGGFYNQMRHHSEGHAYRMSWLWPNHFWLRGLIYCYYTTGEPRFYRAANGMADWFLDRAPGIAEGLRQAAEDPSLYNDRWTASHAIRALATFYEASGEEKYLEAAALVTEAAIDSRLENGSLGQASLTEAVLQVAELTGEARFCEAARDDLRLLITDAQGEVYHPEDNPEVRVSVRGVENLVLLGDWCRLTGDMRYAELGRAGVEAIDRAQDKSDNPRYRGNWMGGRGTSYSVHMGYNFTHIPSFLRYLDARDRETGRVPTIGPWEQREE